MSENLLIQLLVILLASRALSWLLHWIGQPPVIGEMVAGLLLGPLVFGAFAPQWQSWLFAPGSLSGLKGLSQLGLVLFMFIVGAELRLPGGGREARSAVAVGLAGVLLPMALAISAAPVFYDSFAPAGIGFWPFALFLASAVAITAMPVMARILGDCSRTHTAVGRLALSAAAVDDVLAWVMLALTMSLIAAQQGRSSDDAWLPVAHSLFGLAGLLALSFGLLRPLLHRLLAGYASSKRLDGSGLALLLAGSLACAAVTEWLHLHAVFGAFLFGLCLPRDDALLAGLVERIKHFAVVALMPVFFALAGLSTSADAFLMNAAPAFALVMLVAVSGKLLGGAAAARWSGLDWRSSFAVGSLINARGLMELIVIRIGLDTGVINREMFTLLFLMAILTSVMATPMLLALDRRALFLPSAEYAKPR